MMEALKVVYSSPTKQNGKEQNKPLSINPATIWNIDKHDPTGRALRLYLFYVQKAIDQNSPQPWAIDSFCARRLKWNIKTVRNARQVLQKAKVVEQIHKRRSSYIRVHFLTDKIKGPSINMQIDGIPHALMGTCMVLDYYTAWFENIKFHKNFSRFQKDVQKKLGRKVDEQEIINKMEQVWDKINETGFGMDKINNELSFFFYMLASVVNKFKEKN